MLDTHALIWWFNDDKQLGPSTRVELADRSNEICVSKASFWEIALKLRTGKLTADIGAIHAMVRQMHFTLIEVEIAHFLALADLPFHHRDPFDHVLIAQAVVEHATLVSDDHNIRKYPIQVLACS